MVKTFRMVGVALSLCALVLGSASCKDDDDDEKENEPVSINSAEIVGKYYNIKEKTTVDGKTASTNTFDKEEGTSAVVALTGDKFTIMIGDGEDYEVENKGYNKEVTVASSSLNGVTNKTTIKFVEEGIFERTVKTTTGSGETLVVSTFQKIGELDDAVVEENPDEIKNSQATFEVGQSAYFENASNKLQSSANKCWIKLVSVQGTAGTKIAKFEISVEYHNAINDLVGTKFEITLGDNSVSSSYIRFNAVDMENPKMEAVMQKSAVDNTDEIIFCMDSASDKVILMSATANKVLSQTGKATETLISTPTEKKGI